MKRRNKLRTLLLSLILSGGFLDLRRRTSELHRRVLGRKRVVSVFVDLDDPYSYLLCSYLAEFLEYYDVDLRLYLTGAGNGEFRPAPELYAEYAIRDCRRLALELGIPFLDRGSAPPIGNRAALLAAMLSPRNGEGIDQCVIAAITAYWRGDTAAVERQIHSAGEGCDIDELLRENQQKLRALGHYNTAMLHYGGEWFWGVDRLHYLTDRLNEIGAVRQRGPVPRIDSIRQTLQPDLPVTAPAAAIELPPVELFHSFRSPYSYLLLARIMRIADAFGATLDIRPVMPMVMRGMQVPGPKLRYILTDASREARVRGIPFGRIADPIGPGIERCMAVFEYAKRESREREFTLIAGRAIWSSAVDVATDDGLREVAEQSGLSWPDVLAALDRDEWRTRAEENRSVMMASGCWGVPTVRIGDWVCWGQDRDWLIARCLQALCDNGKGVSE